MKHKWHKEIKAWADGAEIECICISDDYDNPTHWKNVIKFPEWDDENMEFRIKPQPKEPQYLYVYDTEEGIKLGTVGSAVPIKNLNGAYSLIGRIKLEE
jgi:hypothetical protein